MACITRPKSGGFKCLATKDSASSDCNSGGSTATMSSTTASLMARTPLYPLMKLRSLQELGPVGRSERDVEGDAFMMHRQRHVDAGGTQSPELSVEAGLACDFLAVDGEDHVACLELRARCRAVAGNADHDDAVIDLGRVHAKPRPRRLVDLAEAAKIVEHGTQQIDRNDHV